MSWFRMIDANANRAREGLRVLEDIARFVLSDEDLATRCKRTRHGVTNAVRAMTIDDAQLLASRNTPGDVGTTIKTQGELARADLATMVNANAGRAAEALRVLGECSKMVPATDEASRQFEQARYEVYELHRVIGLALGAGTIPDISSRLFEPSPAPSQPRVCVLITESLCTHHNWQEVARQALEGGADMLQLREKSLEGRELLARARWLVELCQQTAREQGRPIRCVINDRPDIALVAGAWGVHVGQGDLSITDIRRLAGHSLRVGVSTESIEQAMDAVAQGADLCGVGPMFATTTKDKPHLAGPQYVRAYVNHERIRRVPHLAIGGITPANVPELVRAGCHGIAVSSVVCSSPAPADVVRALLATLAKAP